MNEKMKHMILRCQMKDLRDNPNCPQIREAYAKFVHVIVETNYDLLVEQMEELDMNILSKNELELLYFTK